MKNKMIAVIWAAAFVIGLMVIQISRYVSDVNGVFTVGIILSAVSGLGLLFEFYERRK